MRQYRGVIITWGNDCRALSGPVRKDPSSQDRDRDSPFDLAMHERMGILSK